MSQVERGRWSAEVADGTVVFLIGMRVNRVSRPWTWVPTAVAMTRMLRELGTTPDLGLLDVRQYVSGRTILGVQYWQSWDHLHAYSRATDHVHLPAWRAFNRRARRSPDVGVFHETYVTGSGANEAVYVDMPSFGLARATSVLPVRERGDTAAHRLDPNRPEEVSIA